MTAVADEVAADESPHSSRAAAAQTVAAWEWVLLAVVLVALAWSVSQQLAVNQMLGHDEAAYATRARSWLDHTTTTSWSAHRSPGLPVLGVPLLFLGGGPTTLRLVGLAFAVALVVGVWTLTRRLGGPVGAPVAAAVVAFSPPLLEHAGLYLTDLPAAALVVWLIVVVLRETARPGGPGAGLLWAAPLAAGALWLRLGAVLPLGLVGATAVLLWPRQVIRGWRWVIATTGFAIGLLWLHFAGSIAAFGTPWGRILYTSQLTRASEPGLALATYVRDLPSALAGPAAGVAMVLGVVATPVRLLARRRWDHTARATVLVAVTAVGHLVAMGVSSSPEVRFVFPSVVLFSVLGAAVLDGVLARTPTAVRPGVAFLVTVAPLAVGVGPTTADLVADRRASDARYDAMRAAIDEIRTASDGACAVMTGYVPQVEWLSRCATTSFGEESDLGRLDEYADRDRYVLFLRGGKREPEGPEREALLEGAEPIGVWDEGEGLIERAELYRVP